MKRYSGIFFIIIILILSLFMLINPRETVTAASAGIKLWYSTVLPALLPFFIVADLLVSLRFANFLGIVLEPVMRPIFRLPGCSALVVIMGFTSGFPVGALLTRKLYDKDMLTANEAERLVSFTNNSSPLFILGAVGVGMFANPAAGYLLATAHYLSNLGLGFIWRYRAEVSSSRPALNSSGITQALAELTSSDNSVDNSIGKILGDAIKNSLNNILAVGGFIIIFSVLTRMLTVWGIMDFVVGVILRLLAGFGLSYPLAYGLGMGIFEMTIGAQTAIAALDSGIVPKLLVVSSILSFSGFSIIAQIMSIVAGTPIRLSFYLVSRILQIIMSGIITFILYRLFFMESVSTINLLSLPVYKVLYSFNAWTFSLNCMLIGLIILLVLVLLSQIMDTGK